MFIRDGMICERIIGGLGLQFHNLLQFYFAELNDNLVGFQFGRIRQLCGGIRRGRC